MKILAALGAAALAVTLTFGGLAAAEGASAHHSRPVAAHVVRLVPAAPAPVVTFPAPTVPPVGLATAWGCGPALQYLQAYADPGFTFECAPGDAQGHQATTCTNPTSGMVPGDACEPGQKLVMISDPCPAAYMNETSNTWILTYGDGWLDPYGACPS